MKKFLSLVLALVMTMSLVTVSAGAEDFADDGEITYKEAVDVISALGIVDGYSDDSFRPDGVLTRGAAAKIICNLILGPTTAEALSAGTAPFKDVPVTNTFAGYITYCSQQGIISGYADGTFRPTGTLSGNAFMKMLLGALGYDSSIEGYTGANWTVNVIKQAVGIGLDDGNDNFVGSQAVTREEAALYAFNMLNATMVEYDQQNTIVVGDITINTTSSRKDRANTTDSDGNIDRDRLMQFAELYFTDLSKRSGTTDEFERPSTTWRLKSQTIGTYADEADVTYTSTVKVGDIYSDLGLDDGIDDSDVTLYVDGKDVTSTWGAGDIVRGSRVNATASGNGAVTQVFYDEDADTITIVVVNTYVGKVSSVRNASSTRDAYVTLDVGDSFTGPGGTYDTDEFDKDDIVYYTYSYKTGEKCIESMGLAESVTGTMSRYTTEGSVTVAGTKYDANVKSADNIKQMASTVDRSEDVTVYLDPYGYGLYVDADTSVEYAVVLNYTAQAGDFNDTAKAKLLFTDGTTATVEVDVSAIDTSGTFTTPTGGKLSKYDIVSYSIDSDDVYDLNLVADSQAGKAGGSFSLNNGSNTFSITDGNKANVNGSKNTTAADGKTIFLVADTSGDKTTYSVYEGFANVPTIKHNGGTAGAVAVFMDSTSNGSPATVVFIEKNDDMTMISDNEDVIYIKGSNDLQSYTSDLGYFYEYDAFINGEEGVVRTSDQYKYDALVYGPIYNEKGIMTGAQSQASAGANTYAGNGNVSNLVGTDSVTNDVIKLGNKHFAYTSDVNTYFIDVDGNLEASDITAIAKDDTDQVFVKTNDKGLLTDVYVKVVDETETVNPGAGTFSAVMGKGTSAGNLTLTVSSTDTTDNTTTFTAKIYAFALASGKDTAVEVGTVGTQTLSSGTFKVAPAITGTVGTQVYYAVVTMSSGEVVTTSTIIGG
ncbi:S-layer homology domain-containing protein [Oscillibacter valericigenes]|uniref:S-layer homology domain-containing protein n=1 Tax=Oscillibacter valericigenes TaxID=351091 RepID=A0ABS2FZN4_9FIRM|nr:S-layer homology domain-containing protein [Oscillibacter valericigenes]MBM6852498.1 S-layer homology domain-containing protein [Oscillibacter valericigenes]